MATIKCKPFFGDHDWLASEINNSEYDDSFYRQNICVSPSWHGYQNDKETNRIYQAEDFSPSSESSSGPLGWIEDVTWDLNSSGFDISRWNKSRQLQSSWTVTNDNSMFSVHNSANLQNTGGNSSQSNDMVYNTADSTFLDSERSRLSPKRLEDECSAAQLTPNLGSLSNVSSNGQIFYEDMMSPVSLQSTLSTESAFLDSFDQQAAKVSKLSKKYLRYTREQAIQHAQQCLPEHNPSIMPMQGKIDNSIMGQTPKDPSPHIPPSVDTGQDMTSASISPGPSCSEFTPIPSVFSHQNYASMMGINQMIVHQARRAANQNPPLPISDGNLTKVLQPSVLRSSATKRSHAHSTVISNICDPSKKRLVTSPDDLAAVPVVSTERKQRFTKTKEALEKSGLMGITMKTANLLKSNDSLEQEIHKLKMETEQLLQAILSNPRNESDKGNFDPTK